ncbi:MAG: Na+/H+ antiporter NhaC family protein [Parashewanella sp.]
MTNDLLTLLPLMLTLGLALTIRNTLLALLVGILSGALVLHQFQATESVQYIYSLVIKQFHDKGSWQSWHLNILSTMLLLGIMTKMLARSHAVTEFGYWLSHRITSQRQARLGIIFLGWFVFIDGLFSCLAVGNICRPLASRYKIPKTQLAYFVDANASSMCSLIPFSSWGPFVIAILASISFLPISPIHSFAEIAQMNFYAISTLFIALLIAWSGTGFHTSAIKLDLDVDSDHKGTPWLLMLPILTLLIGSVLLILISGAQTTDSTNISDWLAHADIGSSMRNASLASVLVALISLTITGRHWRDLTKDIMAGVNTMRFAICILIFTWLISQIVSDLKVAHLLANWADIYLSSQYLLAGLFFLCALMAFSTGSSWGTFGIMLPIGGEIAHLLEPVLVLPALSAVMAGSVFGDHCSPISDTSVLSATSSGCTPQQHVLTQLPFALIAAFVSAIGFQLINWGMNYWLVMFSVFITASCLILLLSTKVNTDSPPEAA